MITNEKFLSQLTSFKYGKVLLADPSIYGLRDGKVVEASELKEFAECMKKQQYAPLKLDYEERKIQIIQSNDLEEKGYIFCSGGPVFSIEVTFKDGNKKEVMPAFITTPIAKPFYLIEFDYLNPIKNLELKYISDLGDPLKIEVETINADIQRIEKERTEIEKGSRLEKLNANHSVGSDLVNIYFQNSTDNVNKTEIELYVKLVGDSNYRPIGKYIVEKGMFFHAITNLAFGQYAYRLVQYDVEENLIISSEKIPFFINRN